MKDKKSKRSMQKKTLLFQKISLKKSGDWCRKTSWRELQNDEANGLRADDSSQEATGPMRF
jgi:hypothetical protein